MKQFLQILYDLSAEVDLELFPDSHEACQLLIANQIKVQIELDPAGDKLILGCLIIEIPVGKFREKVLLHAMVANYQPAPSHGYLCYVAKNNHLSLWESIPVKNLTGATLKKEILLFAQKALGWYDSLRSGEPAPFRLKPSSSLPSPHLGIKP